MIAFLRGRILRQLPSSVILDTGGVGYELMVPLPSLLSLPVGEDTQVEFWVYTRVREDSLNLYGFLSWSERQTFEILIQVSGIGPKVAMAMMASLGVEGVAAAVASQDPARLAGVPGIGKRTSEKILLELRSKQDQLPVGRELSETPKIPRGLGIEDPEDQVTAPAAGWTEALRRDLISALTNLGFRDKEMKPVLRELEQTHATENLANLVKLALQGLVGYGGKPQKKPVPAGRDHYA